MSDTLAPFRVELVVKNKEEVIAAKVGNWWGVSYAVNYAVTSETFATKIADKFVTLLPTQLGEAGIDLTVKRLKEAEPEGLCCVTLEIQILGFDLGCLVQKGMGIDGAAFNKTFTALQSTLTSKMGMEEKAIEIGVNVGNTVRSKIMGKLAEILPQKMNEQGIKVSLNIPEMKPQDSEEAAAVVAEKRLALDTPFVMSMHVDDREALLNETINTKQIGGRLKKFVATKISDEKFNAIVGEKLEEKIPAALAEKGIQLSFTRLPPTEDAGIVVQITIESFDLDQLLVMSKGAEFASGFAELLALLTTLAGMGMPHLLSKKDDILAKISGQVREKMSEKITEALATKLHATVTCVDSIFLVGSSDTV